MSLAPGRTHDMAMLEDRLANAKTAAQWAVVRRKMDDIIAEGKDRTMHSLRGRLLSAARAGDNEAGDRISMEIYEYQRRKGTYKHIKNSNEKED